MFKTSISRLLTVLQGVIVLGFIGAMAIFAVNSWKDSRSASNILEATKADQALFKALIDVRQQLATIQTAVAGQAAPTETIAKSQQIAKDGYDNAAATIAELEINGISELRQKLSTAWQEMTVQATDTVQSLASQPLDQRDLGEIKPWTAAVFGVMNAINDTSRVVGNEVRLLDPYVAEMIQIRRSAWTVRDRFGSQCTLLRPIVSDNTVPSAALLTDWNQRIGTYRGSWDTISSMLARNTAPQNLVSSVNAAKAATAQTQEQLINLVSRLDGTNRQIIAPADYTAMCNAPFNQIVDIAFMAMDEAVAFAEERQATANVSLGVSLAVLVLVVALAVVASLSVRNRFAKPLGKLMGSITILSNRDFTQPVAKMPYPDELGRLSDALEELRKNALHAEELQTEQHETQKRQIERGEHLQRAVGSFEKVISRVTSAVRSAAVNMKSNAENLSAIAKDTTHRTEIVSDASSEASGNVQTVASASEELSASIIEVNQQINGSSQMANDAVDEVERTNVSIEDLKQSANKIGEVVELIQSIASQTNLLALNATIEAARAGDAGKGFAVVANEVKALATQTHKATEDISAQIAGMQEAVGGCVTAIGTIGSKIRAIDEAVSAIAAATEEQSSATQEIARNVQQAANGTTQVSENITSVTEMAGKTGHMSADVLEASSDLAQQADALGKEVDRFLEEVKSI
ncbi:methyl-accepting chemotaxis protein [Thalassospira sp. MA62]|nr:methyl-accepting chemotaxis protein [Thalassospira sp. MA62]